MVDLTWAHWGVTPSESEAEQSWSRHQDLLNILLGRRPLNPSGPTGSGNPVAPPGAWISLDPDTDALKERIDSLRGGAGFDDLLWPWKWFNENKEIAEANAPFGIFVDTDPADRTVRFIVDGLKQCELTANRAKLRKQPGLLAAQMDLFACRIYLTPQRAAKLIHGSTGKYGAVAALGHAMIELRFRENLGRYWLYATFSVWTHQPSIPLYPLSPVDDREDKSPLGDRLEALRDRYALALRRGFQDHVHAFFPAAQVEILGRRHQPPRFWMASGQGLTTTAAASANGLAAGDRELLSELLFVPHPDTIGLGAGDIDGRARVYRRFIPNPGGVHDRPVYLILPFSTTAIDQEKLLRSLIQRFIDLETDAATRLFGIVADIDIYCSQLNLYNEVASQGSALWDQVALFLPVARGSHLSKVHRLIELIHQVLLQGISDLEDEAAKAQHTIERIEFVANDLIDQFDRRFTERPVSERMAIRDSLEKAGYFDKARRAAQSVREQSRQVGDTYKALLGGMTYAFDERRVRETDLLQWVALWFAFVLGVISIWNEFLSEYIKAWRVDPWVEFGLAGIIVAIVAMLAIRRRRSRLTTTRFNKRFKKLQELLADYSSESLDQRLEEDERNALCALDQDKENSDKASSRGRLQILTTAQKEALGSSAEEWRSLDKRLAQETAELLDDLPKLLSRGPRWMRSRPRAKHKQLHERVEFWALRALLAAERPREFWRSPLPLLTFLYRFFPIFSGKPSKESHWSAAENQVADSDFRFTVLDQCGGESENVPALMRWGHRQVRDLDNASQFVQKLQEVGLRGNMTNKEFCDMTKRMNQPLRYAEEFQGWRKEADENLKAAGSLRRDELYQKACVSAEDSAQLGLTGFLRGVGVDIPGDYDLVRLSVETRATMGPLPSDLQDAIWRLSTYQKPRDQLSIPLAGRAAPHDYGESDAQTAVKDANIVLKYVDDWTSEANPPA